MFTDIVILAGGFGERLWPASSPEYPKQFMTVSGGVSFLQSSVLRALALKPSGKIIIVTRRDLLEPVAVHCSTLLVRLDADERRKIKNDLYIIPETVPRQTTAPLILSCHFLDIMFPAPQHSILVLTSDHIIAPVEKFVSDSEKACKAVTNGKIVCYAIPPTEPATGYGYIKAGSPENADGSVFRIEQFREKPDKKTAEEYVASGSYWWNSGMFGFTSDVLKKELADHEPDVYNAFEHLPEGEKPVTGYYNGIKYVETWPAMDTAYEKTPAIAIDKSVAEKTANAYAVRASFDWDDIGSWDAFEKLFDTNEGKTVEINSANCFVYSDLPVALCGVKDLIVVIKNGNALVMKKGASSMVRDAVKQMKND